MEPITSCLASCRRSPFNCSIAAVLHKCCHGKEIHDCIRDPHLQGRRTDRCGSEVCIRDPVAAVRIVYGLLRGFENSTSPAAAAAKAHRMLAAVACGTSSKLDRK